MPMEASPMSFKAIAGALALALTLYAFYPYIRDILRGRVRPHVFSWVIWALTTLSVALAQLAAGGGPGAWVVAVSGMLSLLVAVLAWRKRGDSAITRTDWLFFGAALSALPLWVVTADPLWAVIVLTVVDLLGFGPTIRKAHAAPHAESLPFFALFLVRNLLVVLALEALSWTTALFPLAIALACAGVMAMIVWRRRKLADRESAPVLGLAQEAQRVRPGSATGRCANTPPSGTDGPA